MVYELGRTHAQQLEAFVADKRAERLETFGAWDHREWWRLAMWELKILKLSLRRRRIVRRLRRLYGAHR